MKLKTKNPCLPAYVHVMDNLNKTHTVNTHVTVTVSLYCEPLNCWLYTDNECEYTLKGTKSTVYIQYSDAIYNMCLVNELLYLVHENGYSVHNIKTKTKVVLRYDAVVQCVSPIYNICMLANKEYYKIVDLVSGSFTQFENKNDTMYIIGQDINNNMYKYTLCNNKLSVNNKVYNLPAFFSDDFHSFIGLSDTIILIEHCNWFIIFDTRRSQFGHWVYLDSVLNVDYIVYANKISIEYEDSLLLLSTSDFQALFFEKTSIQSLLVAIDKMSNSMVYNKDKNTLYCTNEDQTYLFYIYNNKLMATMTCAPYKMHILYELNQPVIHMNASYSNIFIQYKDLSILLITI